jgi:DNA polymerase-1
LRQIYRELEFFSLLRELKPVETTEGKDYRTVESAEDLDAFLRDLPHAGPISVAVDGSVGLAAQAGVARAVPPEMFDRLRPLLTDPARRKVAHDVKATVLELVRRGVVPGGFTDDVMLYAFLLSADPGGCGCEVLAEKFLDRKLGSSVDMRADCALELVTQLAPQVDARGLRDVYDTIDYPLIDVLARMEETGIRVEPAQLASLSERMDAEMARLAAGIYAIAGHEFNINSPQQLGKILYEELKLPAPVKYGKGKTLSTAADILEVLAAEHEIARLVLEYRQIAKLKGTYVDALPALIRPDTGRLHTTFNQAGAATGRLSSSNPNLQNIPIRTDLGREIRAAFVPREGWQLLVADYSQIELRLLAHFSGDPVLAEAFRNGEDIHTRTAAEVFGVGPLMVSPDMRRIAKSVNFGIVYGQTPFGLSANLGIDRREAEQYIRAYFALYKGVRTWIDATIAEVRASGVSRTLFGRERPIPDMNSRNPNARGFAERTAVNTPLQGTAADLIKLAMIRIDRMLRERKLQTKMLLQVHDELVFEAPPDEIEEVRRTVKQEMESVRQLNVPLVADAGVGSNWRDAK